MTVFVSHTAERAVTFDWVLDAALPASDAPDKATVAFEPASEAASEAALILLGSKLALKSAIFFLRQNLIIKFNVFFDSLGSIIILPGIFQCVLPDRASLFC